MDEKNENQKIESRREALKRMAKIGLKGAGIAFLINENLIGTCITYDKYCSYNSCSSHSSYSSNSSAQGNSTHHSYSSYCSTAFSKPKN